MSGEQESKQPTAREYLDKMCGKLDEYLQKLLVPVTQSDKDLIQETLELSIEQIYNISSEELFARAKALDCYAFQLTKEINRNKSKIYLTDKEIVRLMAAVYNNYGGDYVRYEIKREMFCRDHSYARELNTLCNHAYIKNQELEDLVKYLNRISDNLTNLAKVRGYSK